MARQTPPTTTTRASCFACSNSDRVHALDIAHVNSRPVTIRLLLPFIRRPVAAHYSQPSFAALAQRFGLVVQIALGGGAARLFREG
mmetsp:Transcript_6952/g.25610  ORF Transcript_6952/g.25610 Transcript_6952/m.25610 type:complete len:86 (-) Transcript_6952:3426-3683(-)